MSESAATGQGLPHASDAVALDALFAPFNRSDLPGLVVGIARQGKIIYRRGCGLASVELGVANTPWTRMRIGSTSKHFACLAALLLAEQGKLNLDDTVRQHMPELPASNPEPTLRQLMNHTSGYRCYLDAGFLSEALAIRPLGSALAGQIRQRDVNFAAGEQFMYNNGGYHLLSVIIERVSGRTFEQFLGEQIFEPLGMLDTVSAPSDFELHRGMATLHVPLPQGGYKRGIFPSLELRGEGAIISSVDDMLRWLAHLRGPRTIGSDASWTQMIAPTTLNNGTVVPYGLGLIRNMYRGVEVIQHAGGVIGGSCQMLTVPAHALDIIIMTNGAAVNPNELSKRVLDTLLGEHVLQRAVPKAQSAAYRPLLGKRYRSSAGFVMGFTDLDGELGLSLLNMPAFPMYQQDAQVRLNFEDYAAGPFVVTTDEISSDAAASATLQIAATGLPETFKLMPETGPALASIAGELVGHYRAPELDADAWVNFDGGVLTMQIKGCVGATEMTLASFDEDVLGWHMEAPEMPLRGIMHVVREGGEVVSLAVDTMRTRHMAFHRVGAPGRQQRSL